MGLGSERNYGRARRGGSDVLKPSPSLVSLNANRLPKALPITCSIGRLFYHYRMHVKVPHGRLRAAVRSRLPPRSLHHQGFGSGCVQKGFSTGRPAHHCAVTVAQVIKNSRVLRSLEQVTDPMRTDVSGAANDENSHLFIHAPARFDADSLTSLTPVLTPFFVLNGQPLPKADRHRYPANCKPNRQAEAQRLQFAPPRIVRS
jgi:hypothetical protein